MCFKKLRRLKKLNDSFNGWYCADCDSKMVHETRNGWSGLFCKCDDEKPEPEDFEVGCELPYASIYVNPPELSYDVDIELKPSEPVTYVDDWTYSGTEKTKKQLKNLDDFIEKQRKKEEE